MGSFTHRKRRRFMSPNHLSYGQVPCLFSKAIRTFSQHLTCVRPGPSRAELPDVMLSRAVRPRHSLRHTAAPRSAHYRRTRISSVPPGGLRNAGAASIVLCRGPRCADLSSSAGVAVTSIWFHMADGNVGSSSIWTRSCGLINVEQSRSTLHHAVYL